MTAKAPGALNFQPRWRSQGLIKTRNDANNLRSKADALMGDWMGGLAHANPSNHPPSRFNIPNHSTHQHDNRTHSFLLPFVLIRGSKFRVQGLHSSSIRAHLCYPWLNFMVHGLHLLSYQFAGLMLIVTGGAGSPVLFSVATNTHDPTPSPGVVRLPIQQ